jgi:integrase
MKPKNKKIKLKRIKESITEVEYKKLINAVKGDETLRENTKDNLLRTFTILYFTGLRLNELQEMKLSHIKELIDNGETKLILPKTKSERKLFATDEFIKQLKKLFVFDSNTDLQIKVISKGSNLWRRIVSKK